MFYHVLIHNLDLWGFALMGVGAAIYADFYVLKRLSADRPRRRIWLSTLILVTVGVSAAHWVGEIQRERLRISIQGVAPTYADALKLMGHSQLTLDTPPGDPEYLEMIERQKEWLTSYPAITDIYTLREVTPGHVAFMVDSETDYDRDGAYTDDREMRTPIGEVYAEAPPSFFRALKGETVFDDVPVTDRWGTTVSAVTPLYDATGEIEGIVGIDFAAADWIRTLLLGRGCVLGANMTFLIGLLVLISVSSLQRKEIQVQRQFAEKMQAKSAAVQEALRQLRSYQFVLDTHAIVCVTDPHGIILHTNQKFSDLYGYATEWLRGQPYTVIDSQVHPAEFWQDIQRTVNAGRVWHGEICQRAKDGAQYWIDTTIVPYVDATQRITQHISMGTDITAKKQYEVELVSAARLDRLTGLPNRSLFHSRLHHAMQRVKANDGFRFALMFLDFDRFKLINDSLGHDAGDALLREIAARLRRELGSSDCVELDVQNNSIGRLGGDEFVVIIQPATSDDDVIAIAERLLTAFDEPYELNECRVRSTASIGIVFSDSQKYATADEMLRDADTAMYAAKGRGKACYAIFDDSMQYAVRERLQLENDLRDGVGKSEFVAMYRPIMWLDRQVPLAVQVEHHWHHPERGILLPDNYLPIAEETRIIIPLGYRLLESACGQFAAWQRQFPDAVPDRLSVQFTGVQWSEPTIVARTLEIVAASGMRTDQLQLSIRECDFLRDHCAAITPLRAFQEAGVKLALDNFGSGNASIVCLQEFSFDVLTIDESCVEGLAATSVHTVLIQSVCAMAHKLGITSVAEGVDSEEHFAFLRAFGCQCGQGDYLGKSLPAHEFTWSKPPSARSLPVVDLPSAQSANDLGTTAVTR